jgi:tRNA (guanine37-N1)-methyltransferase
MTLRIDLFTIFPAYFDALDLSLAGRARESGLLDVHVNDLRDWTHDRHRTVDDTPYGGGAGMVMKPEPWGEALDSVDVAASGATLVVPTPAGRLFTQEVARELATRDHLVFACGRYEGIDQRVADHAASRFEVLELSVGDYVLNGGEVAALAICEAVARLVPGFMGNPESLTEESHEDGLLEAPVYTKPATWRGLDVPSVLLSGDHGAIARWRHERAERRTADRRPDLLRPSSVLDTFVVLHAEPSDAGELFTLQLACWVTEAHDNPGVPIPALEEDLDDVRGWMNQGSVLVARAEERLVGAVRGVRDGEAWRIGRLMVAPDLRGKGLGRWLLARIEEDAPPEVTSYELFTGAGSKRNQKMYKKAGYRLAGSPSPGVVSMVKPRVRPDF